MDTATADKAAALSASLKATNAAIANIQTAITQNLFVTPLRAIDHIDSGSDGYLVANQNLEPEASAGLQMNEAESAKILTALLGIYTARAEAINAEITSL